MATQTITTAGEIPEALRPFYIGKEGQPGLIERGISEIFPPGFDTAQDAYRYRYRDLINQGLMGEGAIAGLTQGQRELGQRIDALQTPGAFGTAQQFGQTAGAGLAGLQNLQAMGVAAPELMQYQLAGPQMFGTEQAQQYMSPYMQGVVDVQQRKAIDAARQAQLSANLAAAGRSGTYGGSRQAVLQGAREAGLRQEMGDIQARGLQSAYDQAAAQFERDRAAQMRTGEQNLAASLGVQQLGANQSLEAQRANQTAALQAAQQRLGAGQALAGLSQTMGGLGVQQLAGQMDILKMQGAFGDLERSIEQQKMDAQRQALMEQAEYGTTQVGQLSNLLRGVPLSDTRQTTTTPPPSFASQLTGMGLTGVGLYNLMQGGK